MKVGIRFQTSSRMLTLAVDADYFSWRPGLVESGTSSPGERFDVTTDRYWHYSFLWFTLFFAKVVIP